MLLLASSIQWSCQIDVRIVYSIWTFFFFLPPTVLSCPENSHYNICVRACPESCGILSDIPCPWTCYEGCQCETGYMQSGNGCVKADKCGCFYYGHYYEVSSYILFSKSFYLYHCNYFFPPQMILCLACDLICSLVWLLTDLWIP